MKISVYMALIGMLVAVLTTECGAAGPGSEECLECGRERPLLDARARVLDDATHSRRFR